MYRWTLPPSGNTNGVWGSPYNLTVCGPSHTLQEWQRPCLRGLQTHFSNEWLNTMRQINCKGVAFIWCKFTWPAGDQLPKDSFHKEWIYESPPLSPLVFGGCPDHLRFLDSLIILDSRSMPGNKQIALVFICQAVGVGDPLGLVIGIVRDQRTTSVSQVPEAHTGFQFPIFIQMKEGWRQMCGQCGKLSLVLYILMQTRLYSGRLSSKPLN